MNIDFKQLTPEERDFLALIKKTEYAPITKNLADKLIEAAQNGDDVAKNKLINANLRMVVAISKNYIGNNISLFDLIQEGTIALINAINLYDKDKSQNFSTFAYQLIKWHLFCKVNNLSKTIDFPNEFSKLMKDVNNYMQSYYLTNGVKPTSEIIATALSKNVGKVDEALFYLNNNVISLENPISFDDPYSTFYDVLASDYDLEDDCEYKLLWNQFLKIYPLANLTSTEIEVLKRRYGFYNNKKYTYAEIGKILNLTGERVRQLEINALERLRIEMINQGKGRSRRKRNGQ